MHDTVQESDQGEEEEEGANIRQGHVRSCQYSTSRAPKSTIFVRPIRLLQLQTPPGSSQTRH